MQTHLFFCLLSRICPIILDDIVDGKCEQKLSLKVLLSICLIFCQLQPGVAYKIVASKKACIWMVFWPLPISKTSKFYFLVNKSGKVSISVKNEKITNNFKKTIRYSI